MKLFVLLNLLMSIPLFANDNYEITGKAERNFPFSGLCGSWGYLAQIELAKENAKELANFECEPFRVNQISPFQISTECLEDSNKGVFIESISAKADFECTNKLKDW